MPVVVLALGMVVFAGLLALVYVAVYVTGYRSGMRLVHYEQVLVEMAHTGDAKRLERLTECESALWKGLSWAQRRDTRIVAFRVLLQARGILEPLEML